MTLDISKMGIHENFEIMLDSLSTIAKGRKRDGSSKRLSNGALSKKRESTVLNKEPDANGPKKTKKRQGNSVLSKKRSSKRKNLPSEADM